MTCAQPQLVGVAPAGPVLPEITKERILLLTPSGVYVATVACRAGPRK